MDEEFSQVMWKVVGVSIASLGLAATFLVVFWRMLAKESQNNPEDRKISTRALIALVAALLTSSAFLAWLVYTR